MDDLKKRHVWFVTGSQHLYGEEALRRVARDAGVIAKALNDADSIPCTVTLQPVVTTPDAIRRVCLAADADDECIGLVLWMHTFSPAKMWIAGLSTLAKPFLHLHTQSNRDIPWSSIDMDFMNLNQSAHGDREFGFLAARMRLPRAVVVGFWGEADVQRRIAVWMRAAAGRHAMRGMKVARFGDNMRDVAVTEGDKVEAQIRMGYAVYGYGVGDLVRYVNAVGGAEADRLMSEYKSRYSIAENARERADVLRDAARIELGMRAFLTEGGFSAFTTTFEDLHGLRQLPGIAVQRLMEDGYGFGAEGDWKTAALVRVLKVMGVGLGGGTSFMEDYTYHLDPAGMKVLGAHMLEVCPTLADGRPSLEVHPLSIGGGADPVRLVFTGRKGAGVNVSMVDMGNRFRMIVNAVEVVEPDVLPAKLPVARVVWVPYPDLPRAAHAWILAGGAHHTAFSQAVTVEHLKDLAEMTGVECLVIDRDTDVDAFAKEMRWNEVYYRLFER
jgi:L-arabinose isomerase